MSRIRRAKRADLPYVKRLTDENISKDFYTMEYLEKLLEDPMKQLYVYTYEDIPVAYSYVFFAPYAEVRDILNIPEGVERLNALKDNDQVCVYKTTCTDKSYRNKGIHSAFVSYLSQIMDRTDVKETVLEALKLPDGTVPAHRVIYEDGFRPIHEIKTPWIRKQSYCPYCKKQFCECDAVLYVKER